jgi:hypothetical protein
MDQVTKGHLESVERALDSATTAARELTSSCTSVKESGDRAKNAYENLQEALVRLDKTIADPHVTKVSRLRAKLKAQREELRISVDFLSQSARAAVDTATGYCSTTHDGAAMVIGHLETASRHIQRAQTASTSTPSRVGKYLVGGLAMLLGAVIALALCPPWLHTRVHVFWHAPPDEPPATAAHDSEQCTRRWSAYYDAKARVDAAWARSSAAASASPSVAPPDGCN